MEELEQVTKELEWYKLKCSGLNKALTAQINLVTDIGFDLIHLKYGPPASAEELKTKAKKWEKTKHENS